jgi:hypothetical protein
VQYVPGRHLLRTGFMSKIVGILHKRHSCKYQKFHSSELVQEQERILSTFPMDGSPPAHSHSSHQLVDCNGVVDHQHKGSWIGELGQLPLREEDAARDGLEPALASLDCSCAH